MILTAGFSGLLWSPEVRQCGSLGELVRRAQTSVLSAQVCFNSWMIKNPPWLQFDMDKNNKDELLPDAEKMEGIFRRMLEFRMSLIPYLYAAFARYRLEGMPPFRALVMDYPSDPNVHHLDSEFVIGDNLLAAPFIGDASKREVYLPAGTWYCFWTGAEYEGGKSHMVEMGWEQMPLFVREGSILPFAKPVQCIRPDTVFEITCRVYGDAPRPAVLYEDDGVSHDFDNAVYNTLTLSWHHQTGGAARRQGKFKGQRYSVKEWQRVKPL
jgi:alpha-D-xyloside xylohydrolase